MLSRTNFTYYNARRIVGEVGQDCIRRCVLPKTLPFPAARRRAAHPPLVQAYQRRIADLEKRADILLSLLKMCDRRRMAALEELATLKGGRP